MQIVSGATPDIPMRRGASAGLMILLAEDEPTNRMLAIRQLQQLGYTARTVDNGLYWLLGSSALKTG